MRACNIFLGLLIGALVLGQPTAGQAQQTDSATKGSTGGSMGWMGGTGKQKLTISDSALKTLVGTWKGGVSDKDTSITLVIRADTGFVWTGKNLPVCMTKPGKIKRITATNISWCGGPGHNYTLTGKTLDLKPVGGGHFVFTQASAETKTP